MRVKYLVIVLSLVILFLFYKQSNSDTEVQNALSRTVKVRDIAEVATVKVTLPPDTVIVIRDTHKDLKGSYSFSIDTLGVSVKLKATIENNVVVSEHIEVIKKMKVIRFSLKKRNLVIESTLPNSEIVLSSKFFKTKENNEEKYYWFGAGFILGVVTIIGVVI